MEEVREEVEEIEVEVEAGEARAFYSKKGADAFKKYLAKKEFLEERGFKKLVSPFKEEDEKRGWETVSQHMEPRRRAVVLLRQGEMGPFWGKGHLQTLGT